MRGQDCPKCPSGKFGNPTYCAGGWPCTHSKWPTSSTDEHLTYTCDFCGYTKVTKTENAKP